MKVKGSSLALLALAAVMVGSRNSRALPIVRGGGMGTGQRRTRNGAMPDVYAREKLPALRDRLQNPTIRAAVERWGAHFFPGVPTTALIAAGATSMGAAERGGPPDFATGLWGCEWPRVVAWARDDQTMRELRRAVHDTPEGYAHDIEGQAYTGFRSYRDHLAQVLRVIPSTVIPREGSQWLLRLAVSAYSSGPHTVGRIVTAAAPELGGDDRARWRELGAAILRAWRSGQSHFGGVAIPGRWMAAFTIVRNEQRYECGRELATHYAPTELAWYDGGALDIAQGSTLARDLVNLGYNA